MTDDWIDKAEQVRPGEALDVARLEAYLKTHLAGLTGPLRVRQFPRGFSNLTYLLQMGEREMVLRRPPFGSAVKSAHDMGREYRILSQLRPFYAKVPQMLLYCQDEAVLGAPFYVMERVRGVILRAGLPATMVPASALMSRIATTFIDNLAELHAVDYQAAGLGELGRPAGYVERQIKGWTQRYHQARTDDLPEMDRVAAWLAEKMPPESGAALIHNDYKYDNLVLDPADWSQLVAVLDWEMATLGDPLLDLGTTLGYWVQGDDPALMHTLQFSPTYLPGNPSRAELAAHYAQASGRDISNIVYYYVYGAFKLAVIIQQIYYRYKLGLTEDHRFAGLDRVVRACSLIAAQAIARQRLDKLFD